MKSLIIKLETTIEDSNTFLVNNKKLCFDKDNFKVLENMPRIITYVDGGNAQIYGNNSCSLQIMRLCAYNSKPIIKQFFVLVLKKERCFEFFYEGYEGLPNKIDVSVSLEEAINIIRRLAELDFASQYDEVVIDGSLDTKHDFEKKYLDKLKSVAGLSKTHSFLTDKSLPLGYQLYRYKKGSWYYYLYSNKEIDTGMIKLNDNSSYVFRVDTKNFDYNLLVSDSSDSIFLGYPYGLVQADSFARISNVEIENLKVELLSNKELLAASKSSDAHQVLDSLRF
ncbi:MAG: hypothetical protein ACMXX9_03310 [Candidatus Woesearchaeota archaeon]